MTNTTNAWKFFEVHFIFTQNICHIADSISKHILNENVSISNKMLLKFAYNGPIDNEPTLVQIMAWRWSGDKPLMA